MEAIIRHVLTLRDYKTSRNLLQCAKYAKKQGKKNGHLPPKVAKGALEWNHVNVDGTGPYSAELWRE